MFLKYHFHCPTCTNVFYFLEGVHAQQNLEDFFAVIKLLLYFNIIKFIFECFWHNKHRYHTNKVTPGQHQLYHASSFCHYWLMFFFLLSMRLIKSIYFLFGKILQMSTWIKWINKKHTHTHTHTFSIIHLTYKSFNILKELEWIYVYINNYSNYICCLNNYNATLLLLGTKSNNIVAKRFAMRLCYATLFRRI